MLGDVPCSRSLMEEELLNAAAAAHLRLTSTSPSWWALSVHRCQAGDALANIVRYRSLGDLMESAKKGAAVVVVAMLSCLLEISNSFAKSILMEIEEVERCDVGKLLGLVVGE